MSDKKTTCPKDLSKVKTSKLLDLYDEELDNDDDYMRIFEELTEKRAYPEYLEEALVELRERMEKLEKKNKELRHILITHQHSALPNSTVVIPIKS